MKDLWFNYTHNITANGLQTDAELELIGRAVWARDLFGQWITQIEELKVVVPSKDRSPHQIIPLNKDDPLFVLIKSQLATDQAFALHLEALEAEEEEARTAYIRHSLKHVGYFKPFNPFDRLRD